MKKRNQPRNKSAWLIALAFSFLTAGLVAVVWLFIGSLEDNSAKLRKYHTARTGMALKNPLAQTPTFLQGQDELGTTVHKVSTQLYEEAQQLAYGGRNDQAIATGLQSVKKMEEEIRAKDTCPGDQKTLASRYTFLGCVCLGCKRYEESVQYLTKAIELNPTASFNYNRRSAAYGGLGQTTRSGADTKTAQQLEAHMSKMERARSRVLGVGLESE